MSGEEIAMRAASKVRAYFDKPYYAINPKDDPIYEIIITAVRKSLRLSKRIRRAQRFKGSERQFFKQIRGEL